MLPLQFRICIGDAVDNANACFKMIKYTCALPFRVLHTFLFKGGPWPPLDFSKGGPWPPLDFSKGGPMPPLDFCKRGPIIDSTMMALSMIKYNKDSDKLSNDLITKTVNYFQKEYKRSYMCSEWKFKP